MLHLRLKLRDLVEILFYILVRLLLNKHLTYGPKTRSKPILVWCSLRQRCVYLLLMQLLWSSVYSLSHWRILKQVGSIKVLVFIRSQENLIRARLSQNCRLQLRRVLLERFNLQGFKGRFQNLVGNATVLMIILLRLSFFLFVQIFE